MQLKKIILYIKKPQICYTKSKAKAIKFLYLFIFIFLTACTDFVEVYLPKNQLAAEAVFEDTATAALANIYAGMRDGGLVTGNSLGLSYQMGLYSDELDDFSTAVEQSFNNHTIIPSNTTVTSWWDNTYNLIYAANAVVKGAENAVSLSVEDQNQLKGEGLFIRAYLHSLLLELFGPIPYIATTDYLENSTVSRMPVDKVYEQIIADLVLAESLLGEDITEERVRPYDAVANAVLARAYLYTGQWELAEATATQIINNFVWEPDLNKVFLKNSSGSIWQFIPDPESGFANTREASVLIVTSAPPNNAVTLTNSLVAAFESGDQRASLWVDSITDGVSVWYYPFKYKERPVTTSSLEYSVIFRLAEQYLIRAEARVQLGNITGAQSDLDVVRNRAGLSNTTAATTNDLLDAILQERQVELFTEKGHRWFDLKRMGKAAEILSPIKPEWQATNILLPVPESAILINPNLLPQNDGN